MDVYYFTLNSQWVVFNEYLDGCEYICYKKKHK